MKVKDFKVEDDNVYALTECGRLFKYNPWKDEPDWIELTKDFPTE